MSGVPGAGKSYVAHHLLENVQTVYVSRDAIRLSFLNDNEPYFDKESLVQDEFYSKIAEALEDDKDNEVTYPKSVIADATHIEQHSIKKTLRNVERRLFYSTLADYHVVLVYVDTPIDICLVRNARRQGRERVPEHVIRDMYHKSLNPETIKTQVPQLDEVYVIGEWYE